MIDSNTEGMLFGHTMIDWFLPFLFIALSGCWIYNKSKPHIGYRNGKFPKSFDEAMNNFRESLGRNCGWEIHAYNDGKSLIACLKNDKSSDWFLSTSGIHGVEGYTGSAIQTALVKDINAIPKEVKENFSNIMLVHGMNPYGMKHMLRVNANNVDLNRNNIVDKPIFESNFKFTSNMPVLDRLMNPISLVDYCKLPYLLVLSVIKYGMSKCTQGVVTGQYCDKSQMSYGGKEHQPEMVNFFREIGGLIQSGDNVYHMDIHTGYGKYLNEYLMVNTPEDKINAAAVLNDHLISYYVNTEEKHYEHLHGGLTAGFEGMLRKYGQIRLKSYLGIVQEFGTVNYSGIPIFLNMRSLNFWKNHDRTTRPKKELSDRSYLLFNPNTPEYHELIFKRGTERPLSLVKHIATKPI